MMDQTPSLFISCSKQTLEMRDVKTVNIHTSKQETRLASLAVTVCEDGTKLPTSSFSKVKNLVGLLQEFPIFPFIIVRKCMEGLGCNA